MLLRLALRNLRRHGRRTALTAAGLVAGFVLTVFFGAFYDGMHGQMIDHGVRSEAGHLVIQGRGWQAERAPGQLVPDPAPALAALATLGEPAAAVPRLLGEGVVRAAGRAARVQFSGVDPATEAAHSFLPPSRVRGAYLDPADPGGAYLGVALAAALRLEPGDPFVLTTQELGGAATQQRLTVRGLFRTGVSELDGQLLQLPLATAQQLLGAGRGVTQLAVFFADESRGRALAPRLAAALAAEPVEVLPWPRALPGLAEVVRMDEAGLLLFTAILYLILALGVLNTVLTSVLERLPEFGLWSALGARPARIVALVLLEAALLGSGALALGAALVLPLNGWLAVHGLDLSWLLPPGYELGRVALGPEVFFVTRPARVLTAAAAVLGTTLLAALGPALRAARLAPLAALQRP